MSLWRESWRDSLIHERVFACYVLFTLIRLIYSAGFSSPHVLVYFGSLALMAGGVLLTRRYPSVWAWRGRLVIYPVLMNIMFVNLRWVSPLINDSKKDAILWQIDKWITGGSLSVMLEPLIAPPLTEFFSFCYMFFMVYLFLSIVVWLFSPTPIARIFYAGLFSLYGIGYFGYTLVPAVGPYAVYASEFTRPLSGYFMTNFLASIYPTGTNYTDIFPSLHCAITTYLLLFDMKWNRRRFWICLVPSVGLLFSTIYLRYHYFVDVLAGLAVAAAALFIAHAARLREERCSREKINRSCYHDNKLKVLP
ncbi:MAG: phosphatase PAP2 family protein [Desulfobulbaceae bacterium]|jgi:membrane-associated phospholipid phosphatase|nr:phosphatase PAP2 family protein [Desulfobulbaceae bacterium]